MSNSVRDLRERNEGHSGNWFNERYLRVSVNGTNGSMGRFRSARVSAVPRSVSDRRLGVDRGTFGSTRISSSIDEKPWMFSDPMFWIRGSRREMNERSLVRMFRSIWRGAALDRCRLNAAKGSFPLDTNVQISGVEMMVSRQYRQT